MPLVSEPVSVLAVLLSVLAGLFLFGGTRSGRKFFSRVPLLLFAYFVPTALSNLGVIPSDPQFPLFEFIKDWLLPASLILLVLAVDLRGIFRLGKPAMVLFFAGTLSIVVGGPIAYFLCSPLVPPEWGAEAWKGLAALAGSWIGGGANFVAIGESVGVDHAILPLMVVVDVAIANAWMAVLLLFAGREKSMDESMGADRGTLDAVRESAESFSRRNRRSPALGDLLLMLALGLGGTAAAWALAPRLPEVGDIVSTFTWVVLLVTGFSLVLSMTRVRNLEGAGASTLGSVFLYLLVATIGAKADFGQILDPGNAGFLVVGAVWMSIHASVLLLVRRWMRAPVFFLAVGSQANVGGAASAPVVAAAFHPALAPVGVLLAIGGYVLGTVAGIACAALLQSAHTMAGLPGVVG